LVVLYVQVYRQLEALKEGDSDEAVEEAVVAAILLRLGAGKEGFISLIHQLLVCEDIMHDENTKP
jgi:hypothetical protein